MQKIILSIGGMSCSACSVGLEKYLNKQKGIINASVNLVLANALIECEDDVTIDLLSKYIKEAGFENLGIYNSNISNSKENDKIILILFGILSFIVLYISMSHMVHLPVIPFLNMIKYPINYSICLLILSIPYLFYGFDIFKNGYKNLIHKTPNMDTLVSIGVLSSFLYSLFGTIMILNGKNDYVSKLYFESACIVLFFIKFGRFIDIKNKNKTKEAIKDLVEITPTNAILKDGSSVKEVTIDEVKKGDILVCKPGMKVAVDGVIVSGSSYFDEAFITGESIPVKKQVGEKLVAGSLNIDGYIEYEAEKIGKDSTISEIVRLVLNATSTSSPISKLADKVSGVFVPSIIVIALITFLLYLLLGFGLNIALTHFVSVLVVACPCALGLSTPLAIVISEGICASKGILVKKSEVLENASKIDTIVFDKTGTLTYGKLNVSKIFNYGSYTNDNLLKIVSSLESNTSHPIASAFKSDEELLKVTDFLNIQGMGIKGVIDENEYYIGNQKILSLLKIKNIHEKDEMFLQEDENTIVYVIENKNVIALIGLKDIVRKNSKEVIKTLKKMNKTIIMLTGDNTKTAMSISKKLNIDNVISNVTPKDKSEKINQLMKDGRNVMMVGDGINDAISLASSNIGVSLLSGTDIANNSADVILMSNNLMSLVYLIKISEKTIKNIKQNLFWAFFYNVCMIPVAIGLIPNVNLNPMIAGFAMTISSLTVVFNALRLKKIKLEEK